MLLPALYKKDTKGKTRFWQVEIDGEGSYRTIAGELHGNPVTSEWTMCSPKNVGRNNETNPFEQCELEVVALYAKKRDRHYVDSPEAITEQRKYFEVMLAHVYDEKSRRGLFEYDRAIFSQPKLDGLRGPTSIDGVISRGGKPFPVVAFIREALEPLFAQFPTFVFDGELYNHEYREDFNEIVSAIKNGGSAEQIEHAKTLVQFHVYDLYAPQLEDRGFKDRYAVLEQLIGELNNDFIKLVPATQVHSYEELDQLYDQYLEAGYEGQMIRRNLPYEHKRTKSLLKRKESEDAEFPIIRIEEGKGNWAGYAKRIWVKMPNGSESAAGMMGSQAYLHGVLADAERYAGGTATVRYQGFTPDGKLRFGRSLAGRLYFGERDD